MKDDFKLFVCLIIFLAVLMAAKVCSSEKVSVTGIGQYMISKNEKISEGEEYAYKEALRSAVEKVAVRVVSYSKTINNVLEEDIIETFASSVVKVRSKEVKPILENDNIVIQVTISAVVNTDDLERWVPPDIEKQRQLEKDNQDLRNKISQDRREKLISGTGRSGGSTTELAAIALERAQPLISEKRYRDADRVISDTIKGGVEHAELYYQRGWLNVTTKQYGAAVSDFTKAFKISGDSKCLKGRADANFYLKKYDIALQDYNVVISKNPGDATSWANRGACFWALGNAESAVKSYDKAVSLGLAMAERIRYTLNSQYERGTYKMKPTARKVLPLC